MAHDYVALEDVAQPVTHPSAPQSFHLAGEKLGKVILSDTEVHIREDTDVREEVVIMCLLL